MCREKNDHNGICPTLETWGKERIIDAEVIKWRGKFIQQTKVVK